MAQIALITGGGRNLGRHMALRLAADGADVAVIGPELDELQETARGPTRRERVDPFAYLREALRPLPTTPADRLCDLLPEAWFAAHPGAGRKTAR